MKSKKTTSSLILLTPEEWDRVDKLLFKGNNDIDYEQVDAILNMRQDSRTYESGRDLGLSGDESLPAIVYKDIPLVRSQNI